LRHPDLGHISYVMWAAGRLQLWQDAQSETSAGGALGRGLPYFFFFAGPIPGISCGVSVIEDFAPSPILASDRL
jgi:hypothetical protein